MRSFFRWFRVNKVFFFRWCVGCYHLAIAVLCLFDLCPLTFIHRIIQMVCILYVNGAMSKEGTPSRFKHQTYKIMHSRILRATCVIFVQEEQQHYLYWINIKKVFFLVSIYLAPVTGYSYKKYVSHMHYLTLFRSRRNIAFFSSFCFVFVDQEAKWREASAMSTNFKGE